MSLYNTSEVPRTVPGMCSEQVNSLLLLPGHYPRIEWIDGRMNGVSW